MARPLVLYSTITRLAYHVGQKFYDQKHYVWCAPISADIHDAKNPPSSDPLALFWHLSRDVAQGDQHSDAMARNKIGLKRGADVRAAAGVITADQRDIIQELIGLSTIREFAPMLLVIPFAGVEAFAKPVAIKDRANPTSEEYLIDELPRDRFDVLPLNEARQ